jgi:lauroyl/myristoyl acyltransferase
MLRHNLEVATGQDCDEALLEAAVASHFRMLAEMFVLPRFTRDEITTAVVTSGEHHLRDAFAHAGAVVALPHSGNWDLAGAWACSTGMPVTTVAERLQSEQFAAYLRFRESLGMEVLAHDDTASMGRLVAAVRSRRLVCLVADRDLGGSGVPVAWGSSGATASLPAGPAIVARRTGAALVPAVCSYLGDQMEISFGPPVPAAPGRDGLVQMTQQLATYFATRIARRSQDWHMFQPFFLPAASP